ncbi:MAG TPA: succinylglutamate desuccinylase/aspartoacylase family protein [Candidatus Paceibacterota bacterium]|nr:succinylglutamate desuccinylase/aspartoacylase family protein [Candidatus Paceibacterota bacterium]
MQLPEGASIISSSPDTRRCCVIVGGVHGNEPAGIRAINTVTTLARKEWQLNGNVYGLVGNPRAVEKNLRFIDENLNRAFGNPRNASSYEAQRAIEITRWFEELAKTYTEVYVLDLHSVSVGEARIAVFNANNPKAEAWADRVSPISFHLKDAEYVFPETIAGAIERLGGIALIIECGNHSSEIGTAVALEHVERVLVSLAMLESPQVSFQNTVTYSDEPRTYKLIGCIRPDAGFAFDFPVQSETPLTEGAVFAHDKSGEHRAPCDCFIIMPAKHPNPNDTDAGFLAIREK